MAHARQDIVIIGAGLAGLACAVTLESAGRRPLLLEASDDIGGRVRTDVRDGFLLDRGFQVFLTAYPSCRELLDLAALNLRAFEPGAFVWKDGALRPMVDAFRRPTALVSTLSQPVGTFTDKLRTGLLRIGLPLKSVDAIWNSPARTTRRYLEDHGFSAAMIEGFYEPFYGGIFLETDLSTSSRMFEFTFKMFSTGQAALPAAGMQAIPRQLAARLAPEAIRLRTPVTRIDDDTVHLLSGESLQVRHLIVATDAATAHRLIPEVPAPDRWNSVATFAYAAPEPPIREPILVLNGSGTGLIRHLCVPSQVSSSYAPPGQSLVSVTVLDPRDPAALEPEVRSELAAWFGPAAAHWKLLQAARIPHALPRPSPAGTFPARSFLHPRPGLHICGDHLTHSSIEGAILSGQATARALLDRPA